MTSKYVLARHVMCRNYTGIKKEKWWNYWPTFSNFTKKHYLLETMADIKCPYKTAFINYGFISQNTFFDFSPQTHHSFILLLSLHITIVSDSNLGNIISTWVSFYATEKNYMLFFQLIYQHVIFGKSTRFYSRVMKLIITDIVVINIHI